LIARLDIKGPNLIKGVHLEGLRIIGDPNEHAVRYAEQGADELLFMDTVATLYGRNQLTELLEKTTEGVFIPVTVGGGIKSLSDVKRLFDSGADKVAINTAALHNPNLIKEISQKYGSQAITVSIEAKRNRGGKSGWECYTDNGRQRTQRDAVSWAYQAQEFGAGEILLTSIDCEGTRKGVDCELIKAIGRDMDIPVVISGGIGNPHHVSEARKYADAVAVADVLHYKRFSIEELRGQSCQV
jgi:imidazole glycerol-phosphate synthase subunit HisF